MDYVSVGLMLFPGLVFILAWISRKVKRWFRDKAQVREANKLIHTWQGHINRLGYKPGSLVRCPDGYPMSVFTDPYHIVRPINLRFRDELAFHHTGWPMLGIGPHGPVKEAWPGTEIVEDKDVLMLVSLSLAPYFLSGAEFDGFPRELSGVGVVFEWKLLFNERLVEFNCFDFPFLYNLRTKDPDRLPWLVLIKNTDYQQS